MNPRDKKWLDFRALFTSYADGIYFNHASVAPLSTLAWLGARLYHIFRQRTSAPRRNPPPSPI